MSITKVRRLAIRQSFTLVLAAILFIASKSVVAADPEEPKELLLGHSMWAAFECSLFAQEANKNENYEDTKTERNKEAARLFNYGMQAGREFLQALIDGKITAEQLDERVPIGVVLLLEGGSIDFIIGRVFANAADSAIDEIDDQFISDNGHPNTPAEWELDKAIKAQNAANLFQRSNCTLIGH